MDPYQQKCWTAYSSVCAVLFYFFFKQDNKNLHISFHQTRLLAQDSAGQRGKISKESKIAEASVRRRQRTFARLVHFSAFMPNMFFSLKKTKINEIKIKKKKNQAK